MGIPVAEYYNAEPYKSILGFPQKAQALLLPLPSSFP